MTKSILGKRPGRVRSEDGRSAESTLVRNTVKALTAHIGGNPTVAQAMLIRRAAVITLHLARMDLKAIAAGDMPEWQQPHYLGWCNTLARTLAQLGLEAPPAPAPGLADYLASKAAGIGAGGPPASTAGAE